MDKEAICNRVVPYKRWLVGGAAVLALLVTLATCKPEPRPLAAPVAAISQVEVPPAPPVVTAPPDAPKKAVVKKKPRPAAKKKQ